MAYAVSGLLADYFFTPHLRSDGAWAENIGRLFGTGEGRGIGLFITLAGGLLCITAVTLYHMKSVRELESRGVYEK